MLESEGVVQINDSTKGHFTQKNTFQGGILVHTECPISEKVPALSGKKTLEQ
jgi:hypothetical protein